MQKIWEIKNPEEYLKPRKQKRTIKVSRIDERNPGRAYTLSLVFWGLGQGYNDQHGKALVFHLAMLALYVGTGLCIFFRERVLSFLIARFSPSHLFLSTEILLLSLLVFWLSIAGEAYHTAKKMRKSRFAGIPNRIYPCICSLLLPGWGQFLNGQPVKGTIFSALSVLGIFSAAAAAGTLLVWSWLDPSDARFMIEVIFAGSLLFAPLMPFVWLFSSYDALKVSIDDLKKEPLLERIRSANNRRRNFGWGQTVLPVLKSVFALVLLLTVIRYAIHHGFLLDYYAGFLNSLGRNLQHIGMTLVPDFIATMLSSLR